MERSGWVEIQEVEQIGVGDNGDGVREKEVDGDVQVLGLGSWVDMVYFLRCRIQQEKGVCVGRFVDQR